VQYKALFTTATFSLTFPTDGTAFRVPQRPEDELPQHVKGSAFWKRHPDDPRRDAYFARYENHDFAIENIHGYWYNIYWSDPSGAYITRYDWQITKKEREIYGLGDWLLSDTFTTIRTSPVEEKLTTDPLSDEERTPTTESPEGSRHTHKSSPEISAILLAKDIEASLILGPSTSNIEEDAGPEQEIPDFLIKAPEPALFPSSSMTTIQTAMTASAATHPLTAPLKIGSATVATTVTQQPSQVQQSSGGGGGQPGGPPGGGQPGGGGGQPGGPPGGGQPGGGGGGPPAGGPAPAAAAAPAAPAPVNGRTLNGSPPQIFDGSRNKSDVFIQEFSLYQMINRNHDTMRVPYNRILMCLSYMKGPRINDWVMARATEFAEIMDAGGNPDDEVHWDNFKRMFLSAYTDTTKKEDAVQQLLNLRMQGDDLDNYVSAFEHLAQAAGWERDSQGTIFIFKRGLKQGLGRAIIERTHPHPVTFSDWIDAAHRQHAAYVETRATYGAPYNARAEDRNKWRKALGRSTRGQQRHRDPDAMDVDTTKVKPLSDEERKKLLAEGRCFFCKAQGHISPKCPKKGGKPKINPQRSQTTARIIEADEATVVDPVDSAYQTLTNMTKEDRTQLLDRMIVDDADF
jgi:Retrotransposon gag protein